MSEQDSEKLIDDYFVSLGIQDAAISDNWFARFVAEITNIPGMPDEVSCKIWPIAAKYAGIHFSTQQKENALIEVFAATKAGEKAANSLHAPLWFFKEAASEIMRREWEGGSSLPHHKMAQYVENLKVVDGEYQWHVDEYPFRYYPVKKCKFDPAQNKRSAHQILVDLAKQVAMSIKRPDLIYGFNKK